MKKLICVIVILCLNLFLLVGCGNETPDAPIDVTPVETPEPTPVSETSPEPLTGRKRSDDYPTDQSPVAVMVNNFKSSYGNDAFPQWGIGDADVMYEMVTEGGITRLMAVFSDYKTMPSVGPIRSTRDAHVQLVLPYNPLIVHEGASIFAERMLGAGVGADEYTPEDFSMYDYRTRDAYNKNPLLNTHVIEWDTELIDQGREPEAAAYTTADLLTTAVETALDTSGEPSPIFNFIPYTSPARKLADGNADKMHFQFSGFGDGWGSYYTSFDYNKTLGAFQKTDTKGDPHIDNNTGEQLSFENVFLLFTEITPYSDQGLDVKDLTFVDLSLGGYGYYFSNGSYEKVRWLKGLPHEPLRIVDFDGHEIDVAINTGKSYIAFTDNSKVTQCTIDDMKI